MVRGGVAEPDLAQLAEAVDAALTGRYDVGPGAAEASASVGLATRADGATPRDLLSVADSRMYEAKRRRRQQGAHPAHP